MPRSYKERFLSSVKAAPKASGAAINPRLADATTAISSSVVSELGALVALKAILSLRRDLSAGEKIRD